MRRIIPHPLRRPHFIRFSLLLVLLLPFHAYVPWRYYSSQRRPGYRLQIARRGYDDYSNPTLEQLFGDKGVLYYQENSIIQENNDPAQDGYLFAPEYIQRHSIQIPLMPFSLPLFPGARDMLHIYEMKYRALMNDANDKCNQTLGRCYVSHRGDIGSIGSLCHIVESKKMHDGQGFYIIEAYQRFKIKRILQHTPYILAEVEVDYVDYEPSFDDIEHSEKLCHEIYKLLKTYLRLARLQTVDEGKPLIELSPMIRDHRPGQNLLELDYGVSRHIAFSNACCHLLSTEPSILQQLLQSQSTLYRLQGVKSVLEGAVSELISLLLDDNVIQEEELQSIQELSLLNNDEDLMPSQDNDGIHIDDELTNSLSYDLGFPNMDEELNIADIENSLLFSDLDLASIEEDQLLDPREIEGMGEDETSDEKSNFTDDWGDIEAFQ